MNVSWIIGERTIVGGIDQKSKRFVPRTGKNGGPVIQQNIVKVYSPKGR